MTDYVLTTVHFKNNLDSLRKKRFASEMKEREWKREIRTANAWWKRIDGKDPVERTKTDVRRAAKEADISDYKAISLVSGEKPHAF